MPVEQAIRNIRQLESKIHHEDLQNLKYEIMRPDRTKNLILGFGLFAFSVGVCEFVY